MFSMRTQSSERLSSLLELTETVSGTTKTQPGLSRSKNAVYHPSASVPGHCLPAALILCNICPPTGIPGTLQLQYHLASVLSTLSHTLCQTLERKEYMILTSSSQTNRYSVAISLMSSHRRPTLNSKEVTPSAATATFFSGWSNQRWENVDLSKEVHQVLTKLETQTR